MFILLLLLVVIAESASSPARCGTFTRRKAVQCFDVLADLNCDRFIDAPELEAFKSNHLTYAEHAIIAVISTEKIMKDCDLNKDGKISHEDFMNSFQSCVIDSSEMCRLKTICERELVGANTHRCPQ